MWHPRSICIPSPSLSPLSGGLLLLLPSSFSSLIFQAKFRKHCDWKGRQGSRKKEKGDETRRDGKGTKQNAYFSSSLGVGMDLDLLVPKPAHSPKNPWINFLGLKKNPPHIRRRKTCFTSQPGYSKSAGKHLPTSPLRSANVELIKIKTIF